MTIRKSLFKLKDIEDRLLNLGFRQDKVIKTNAGDCVSYVRSTEYTQYWIRFYPITLELNELNTLVSCKGISIFELKTFMSDLNNFNILINQLFPLIDMEYKDVPENFYDIISGE